MKIFKKLAYMSALAMLATGIAACSDDDDYTRAKPVPEDCMQVYFSELNESAYELAPDVLASTKIDLSVMRLQTADAASVPVKVYQTGDIFVVPATVDFAAGQATATLSVSFKEAATGNIRSAWPSRTSSMPIPTRSSRAARSSASTSLW